jgi:hypothetical protein
VEGKSVTGGLVYRGRRFPELTGAYLYADFVSGNVWAMRWDGKKVTANPKIARTSLLISAFGEDEAGEAYFTAFDGFVYRFRTPLEKSHSAPAFPRTLTETGLFASVKDHTPAAGLIPYTVNVPLWSDGAAKDRFLVLPEKGKVVFKEQDQWEFPVGTVLVKTFLLNTDLENPKEMRRLETRLLVHNRGGGRGTRTSGTKNRRGQPPGGLAAHAGVRREDGDGTGEAGVVLPEPFGLPGVPHTERRVRHGLEHPAAQPGARVWQRQGQPDPGLRAPRHLQRAAAQAGPRAGGVPGLAGEGGAGRHAGPRLPRRQLCHVSQPRRSRARRGRGMDMRFHVPLQEAFPGKANWLTPGDPARSVLLKRMTTRHADAQMPPLATNRVDEEAVDVIRQWIKQLPAR